MSEDMSDMMQKIGAMLNNGNIPDNVKQAMNGLKDSSETSTSESSENSPSSSNASFNPEMIQNLLSAFQGTNQQNHSSETSSTNDSSIDFETILKMKKMFDKMNQTKKDDPRSTLLLSLKPYMREGRKEKVDQYVKFLNMGKIIEVLKPDGGENSHDV